MTPGIRIVVYPVADIGGSGSIASVRDAEVDMADSRCNRHGLASPPVTTGNQAHEISVIDVCRSVDWLKIKVRLLA